MRAKQSVRLDEKDNLGLSGFEKVRTNYIMGQRTHTQDPSTKKNNPYYSVCRKNEKTDFFSTGTHKRVIFFFIQGFTLYRNNYFFWKSHKTPGILLVTTAHETLR